MVYAFESNTMSALIRFYRNVAVIYELEDNMCYVSKPQIDHDFWPVPYLRNEVQEYKT